MENLWGKAPDEQMLTPAQSASSHYWRDGDCIVYRSPVQYTDLYLYSTVSWSGIQSAMHEQMGAVAWIIAGGFLLVLVLTIIISIHIYHPFKKILAALNTPAGLMSDRVSISRDEEAFILDSIRGCSSKTSIFPRNCLNVWLCSNRRNPLRCKAKSIRISCTIHWTVSVG